MKTYTRFWKMLFLVLIVPAFLYACSDQPEDTTPVPTTAPTVPGVEGTDEPPTVEPDVGNGGTVEPTSMPAVPVTDIDWQPQVIYSSPAPGEEVLLDGAITVRFDQPMNAASVQEAFVLEGDSGLVTGDFQWTRPDTLIFTPEGELNRKTTYNLRIANSAKGANGLDLRESVNLQIETVGFLQVSQVLPDVDSRDIDTDAGITVIFNRPVVPLVATSQQADLPNPLAFTPAIPGQGQWVSTSIYRFLPSEPLAGATTYQVEVDPSLTDVVGNILEETTAWEFTTVDPVVVTIFPDNRSENILPEQPITVTFNMPMDTASVESAISISPNQPLNFNWQDGNRVVGITPTDKWELGALHSISISDSARSANGSATLKQNYDSGFTVVPLPRVVEVFPKDNSVAEQWQRGITIRFASPMDRDTLDEAILIDPAPENSNVFYSEWDFSYTLDFTLQRNTEYRVTVPATAADPYGNTIGEDYTWTFTTPPFEPLVSLALPFQISQLSTSYPTDVPVIYRNVSQLNAALFNLDLPIQLLLEPYRIQDPDYRPGGELLQEWSLSLSAPLDQAATETLSLANGDTLPTGFYLLQVDAPEIGQDQRYWQNQSSIIVVADTNLVVKQMFDGVYVWATNLAGGRAVGGLEVRLYDEFGAVAGMATTDSNGFAQFDHTPQREYLDQVTVLAGRPGETGFGVASTQWDFGVNPWLFNVNSDWGQGAPIFSYLYTDRPLYRPGDTVFFRGILRDTDYGRYNLPEDRTSVTVEMVYNFNFEENNQNKQTLDLDKSGNFSGSFTIPSEAQVGEYRLLIQDENYGFERPFTVAEYRKPEFVVSIAAEKAELLRGGANAVTVNAEFFFGGSATDLPIQYTIYQKPYQLFPPALPYYSFSDDTEYFYRGDSFFNDTGYFGDFVLSGEGRTDGDGNFVLEMPASLLEKVADGSVEVTVEANVLDLGNFPVAAHTSIIYHASEIYVGITPSEYVGNVGQPTFVDIVTLDWNGERVANAPVEVIFYSREWEQKEIENFGQRQTQWVPIDTEVSRSSGTTNENGEVQASFTPENGGSYVAKATVTDQEGRTHSSNTFFWVADPNYSGWRVDPKEKRMDLTLGQEEYQVGDTASILVQSPFEGPVQAWLQIERGRLIEQRLITLQTGSDIIELPILAEYAPNVHVTIVAVKGIDESNPYADIRLGLAEIRVNTEQLVLDVQLTPRQDLLQPGETVTYDVLVTDYAGNPVSADLSISLVDLAILTLKEDTAQPIVEAFYHTEPYRSRLGSGLFVSGEGIEIEIPEQQGGFGGGGGGDGAVVAESFALDSASDEAGQRTNANGEVTEEIRSDFRDTAYWEAVITTNADGTAVVDIPLPDNLTTWRLRTKAVTADTLVGEAEVDVVATKPLLVRPVTPRFFTVGDVLKIGTVVNNNSNDELRVSTSVEATGLTLQGEATKEVTLAAHSQVLVQWEATVEDVAFVDLTFRASSGNLSDASKPTFGIAPDQRIPVYRYTGEDIVGTSGVVEDGTEVEAILLPAGVDTRQGTVNMQVSASLAAALLDTLDALDYDYDRNTICAHSVIDQLLPNVVTARALSTLNLTDSALDSRLDSLIAQGLSELGQLQKSDGGWGWCATPKSDEYLSAYILLGLVKAQEAGYSVDSDMLTRGTDYLRGQIDAVNRLNTASDVNRHAFFFYVLAEAGEKVGTGLDQIFEDKRDLLDPYAQAFLVLAYEIEGNNAAAQTALLSDLNNSVVLSATGAHWEDTQRDWDNLSSDIRGTAIILDALATVDAENPIAQNAVRWLMSARTARTWQTGQQNSWVILALTDWMEASGELDANFAYALSLNGDRVDAGEFDSGNIADVSETAIPLAEMALEDVNFLAFTKDAGQGRLYYTAHLDSFIDANVIGAVDRGYSIERTYYDASCDAQTDTCEPITQIEAGQQVRVELTIVVANNHTFAVIEDHIPAGAEAIDPNLNTSAIGGGGEIVRPVDDYRYGYWGWWYFNRIEYRDERVVFTSDYLPAGTYQYTYTLQTTLPGRYQVMPTVAKDEFFPEVFGRSAGMVFEVVE